MQTIKAIKLDSSNSVLLEITEPNKDTFNLWFDLTTLNDTELDHATEEDDITGDWNKYIFHIFNAEDMRDKNFQENENNYTTCLDVSIEYFKNFPF